jgi:hypothetical protein
MQQALNNSTVQGDSAVQLLDAETAAALGAGQAQTAAAAACATEPDLRLLVRQHWVCSRLLQAQGRLSEADAEGKACLQSLQQLEQLSAQQPLQAATGTGPQQGTHEQQRGVYVRLPNCAQDSTIDAAAVRHKLDQMWLSMQLLAAEQQLRDAEAALRQLQLLCKPSAEQQQQQQQGAVEFSVVLQLVQQVHACADAVLKVLSPRCLVEAGAHASLGLSFWPPPHLPLYAFASLH